MRTVFIGLGAAMLGALPVLAAPSLHDIPWYEANAAARSATLRICRNDYSYARLPDCQNAEQAETRAWATRTQAATQRSRVPTPEETLNDPHYWESNRIARAGALAQCASGNRFGLTESMCAAARAGAALDQTGSVRGR